MKHLKNLIIIATSFILIGVACTSSTDPGTTTLIGNWLKRSAFDGNGRAGAVSFVIGDTAYVGTGFDGSIRYSDFWAYNPTNDAWSQRAIMPTAAIKRNSAAAFTAAGKGYVTTVTMVLIDYKILGNLTQQQILGLKKQTFQIHQIPL